jgi:MFS family permease
VQSWFARAINYATGVEEFNKLMHGLWGVLNVAVALEFAVHVAWDDRLASRHRTLRILLAFVAATSMAVLFAMTPPQSRFNSKLLVRSFTVYSIIAGIYIIGATLLAAFILARHLNQIHGRALRIALILIALGAGALGPVVAILTLEQLTHVVTPEIRQYAFLLSIARLILVPLGCVIAALAPACAQLVHGYYYCRLYSLWRLLRKATPELALSPIPSRAVDLRNLTAPWENLHKRVVEIHDSIHHLFDSWATPDLLDQAATFAAVTHRTPSTAPIIETACWLEVTRRLATSGAPKHYCALDPRTSPIGTNADSTKSAETRRLLKLARTLQTTQVENFANDNSHLSIGHPV